jgi:transcriptional regulator with GAF, ATPase, and Fis domain
MERSAMIANDAVEQNKATANIDMRIKDFERHIIVDALRQSGGIQVKAAAILGIKERSLWHRIKKHRIDITEFKP